MEEVKIGGLRRGGEGIFGGFGENGAGAVLEEGVLKEVYGL